jgi:RNA polymerase sigma factor (sigma-70 family)
MEKHLQNIPTQWSQVLQAGSTSGLEARHHLLVRYHEAVQNYLRSKLYWDPEAADTLYSDFAQRVLDVDPFLRRADPERGRFRYYLAAVLTRMVQDHLRRQARGKEKPLDHQEEPPAPEEATPVDQEFLKVWRQELINHAWKSLEQTQKQTGQMFHTLVRFVEENPDLRSEQIAERFREELGTQVTAAGVRQIVRRGRERFGELLVAEVARTLENETQAKVTADQIEEELLELGLLNKYCKSALERLRKEG